MPAPSTRALHRRIYLPSQSTFPVVIEPVAVDEKRVQRRWRVRCLLFLQHVQGAPRA